MGCSNTKALSAGTGMESASPLTNAMNALNAMDSDVVEEGQKLISQGQEKISNMIDEGEKIINQASEALGKLNQLTFNFG